MMFLAVTKFELDGILGFALVLILVAGFWLFAKSQIKDMYSWIQRQRGKSLGGSNVNKRR